MRFSAIVWSALLLTLPLASAAQGVKFTHSGDPATIDLRQLHDEVTEVPGQGLQVPGIDLIHTDRPRHWIGDGTTMAERELVDSAWTTFRSSRDSVVPGEGVHWLRIHALPDNDLRNVPLILSVGAEAPFEVFLNGRSILRSTAMARTSPDAGLPSSDSTLHVRLPITFACDGKAEVIAVRLESAPGTSLAALSFTASLQPAGIAYDMHRRMMHFGVFIGINLIILVFALVIWALERGDRNWLLLALLSLVSAADTFCDVGREMGALGFTDPVWQVLGVLRAVLVPWPLYLLIMVLASLRGDLTRQRVKRWTVGVIIVTIMCLFLGIAELTGMVDTREGLTVSDGSTPLIATVIVFAVLLVSVVAWFAVVVVRLGIRLLRSRGYERWIGGGALVSSLLALVLKFIGTATDMGISGLLGLLGDYCSYVAVPVSIAIYLAIRSAHHNKLVARQRDDLDEEVKERTAELSAEKDRSEQLLLNILPAEVAEELKRTGAAEAKHFDQATVMFTDFKGFTSLTEQVSAAALVRELNSCFKAFDDIIGSRRIEKIKTIGDAYMAAAGLPDPGSSSPVDVIFAALDMQAFMKARKVENDALGGPAFEMRVGIHTGPVVAGIVGVKKFQYDIWGDTVNTASRMESSGEIGQVNISEATYALVKDEPGLAFTSRGKVQAKGKGEMEMYFVERS